MRPLLEGGDHYHSEEQENECQEANARGGRHSGRL